VTDPHERVAMAKVSEECDRSRRHAANLTAPARSGTAGIRSTGRECHGSTPESGAKGCAAT
jgi:hypothetical protein